MVFCHSNMISRSNIGEKSEIIHVKPPIASEECVTANDVKIISALYNCHF